MTILPLFFSSPRFVCMLCVYPCDVSTLLYHLLTPMQLSGCFALAEVLPEM